MTQKKYDSSIATDRDGTWFKETYLNHPCAEYVYFLLRDPKYPKGRILLAEGKSGAHRSNHMALLKNNHIILEFVKKDSQASADKIADGWRVITPADIIELGSIGFDSDGERVDISRTRYFDKTNAATRKKQAKLIYNAIKQRQAHVAHGHLKCEDSQVNPNETRVLVYADSGVDNKNRTVHIVPQGQSMMDFITEKQMRLYRIFAIGRMKQNPETKQFEMVSSHTFPQFIGLEKQNNDMMLNAVNTPAPSPQKQPLVPPLGGPAGGR